MPWHKDDIINCLMAAQLATRGLHLLVHRLTKQLWTTMLPVVVLQKRIEGMVQDLTLEGSG